MTKEEFILECKKINIDITEELFSKLDRYKDNIMSLEGYGVKKIDNLLNKCIDL